MTMSNTWLNRRRFSQSGPCPDVLLLADATSSPDTAVARAVHAVTRRRQVMPPERYYVGRRADAIDVHIVSRTGIEPLAHPGYRSSATFDWGSVNAGALELSYALLADATESGPTELVCRTFCAEVVAHLEHAGFVLAAGDIAVWLMGLLYHVEDSGRGARAGLGRRAVEWARSRLRRT